jgi:hypothetical protein
MNSRAFSAESVRFFLTSFLALSLCRCHASLFSWYRPVPWTISHLIHNKIGYACGRLRIFLFISWNTIEFEVGGKTRPSYFRFPLFFMLALINFCSYACQSCLAALNIFYSSFFCWIVTSTSQSQGHFVSSMLDYIRLKSPTQLSCSTRHHILQSTISFCHSASYLSGPAVGYTINFDLTMDQCCA